MKVSIITATYNSEKFIGSCLDSISQQTYHDIEHIIIDGKSNDKTINIIKNHQYKNSKIICEIDSGPAEAFDKGLRNATGDIIGFLHSDDIFANKDIIQLIVNKFNSNNSLSAIYGDLVYVKRNDINKILRKWKSSNFKKIKLLRGWMPPHPTLFVKKTIYDHLGGLDLSFKISGDYMSILKMFNINGFEAEYIPKTITLMRIGGVSNRSLSKIFIKSLEDWRALRKNNYSVIESLIAIMFKNLSKVVQFF